jgi:hypothetical protein
LVTLVTVLQKKTPAPEAGAGVKNKVYTRIGKPSLPANQPVAYLPLIIIHSHSGGYAITVNLLRAGISWNALHIQLNSRRSESEEAKVAMPIQGFF